MYFKEIGLDAHNMLTVGSIHNKIEGTYEFQKNYKANGCGHKRVQREKYQKNTLLLYTIVEVYRCGAIQTVESISFFQRLALLKKKLGKYTHSSPLLWILLF